MAKVAREVPFFSTPWGGEDQGEVGDHRAVRAPIAPSRRSATGPSLSPLKGGEGEISEARS